MKSDDKLDKDTQFMNYLIYATSLICIRKQTLTTNIRNIWQSKSRINILSMILERLKEQCHEDFGKAMTKISNEFYQRPGLTIINFLKIF